MESIKDKIAKMIALADGELVTHFHALKAGILVEDIKLSALKSKKKSSRK